MVALILIVPVAGRDRLMPMMKFKKEAGLFEWFP
jgi:hypothetical protein